MLKVQNPREKFACIAVHQYSPTTINCWNGRGSLSLNQKKLECHIKNKGDANTSVELVRGCWLNIFILFGYLCTVYTLLLDSEKTL